MIMTVMPVAQGRHHHRPGTHAKNRNPYWSTGDRMTVAAFIGYALLMVLASRAPHGMWAMAGMSAVMGGMLTRRFVHHTGDRRYSGLQTTPEEDAEFVERTTGPIPVLTPTAISQEPPVQTTSIPFRTVVQPQGRPSWLPQVFAVAGGLVMMGIAAYSGHRAQQSAQQFDANDALLGIPGAWNGYQPTIPAMGTRGWGPSPTLHHFSGGVVVPWEEPYWWQDR